MPKPKAPKSEPALQEQLFILSKAIRQMQENLLRQQAPFYDRPALIQPSDNLPPPKPKPAPKPELLPSLYQRLGEIVCDTWNIRTTFAGDQSRMPRIVNLFATNTEVAEILDQIYHIKFPNE